MSSFHCFISTARLTTPVQRLGWVPVRWAWGRESDSRTYKHSTTEHLCQHNLGPTTPTSQVACRAHRTRTRPVQLVSERVCR